MSMTGPILAGLRGTKITGFISYTLVTHYAHRLGFTASQSDVSLFVLRLGDDLAYLLLYVNDIILTASSSRLLQHVTELLHHEFFMMDLGDLSYFHGVAITRYSKGMFLPAPVHPRPSSARWQFRLQPLCHSH
jgi:hypothetical protein